MRRVRLSAPVLAAVTLAVLAWIFVLGQQLPPTVASHFSLDGTADGFMPRHTYLGVMTGLVLVIAGMPVLLSRLLHRIPGTLIHLPNRDYWLAPGRRDETLRWLAAHIRGFASLTLLFLCAIHAQVVDANGTPPPRLDERALLAGLAAFMAAMMAWTGVLLVRFRRPRG